MSSSSGIDKALERQRVRTMVSFALALQAPCGPGVRERIAQKLSAIAAEQYRNLRRLTPPERR